ncbi:hypothetical protein PCCS19_43690 [Paenibacillus sp. CCS19]|nr:hypothetical protein PCCS19_43690 [Paenibacillus cellulosilyticus]
MSGQMRKTRILPNWSCGRAATPVYPDRYKDGSKREEHDSNTLSAS